MFIILSWFIVLLYFVIVHDRKAYSIWPGNLIVSFFITGMMFNLTRNIIISLGILTFIPLIIGFLMVGYRRIKVQGLTLFNAFFIALAGVGVLLPITYILLRHYHFNAFGFEWLMKFYWFTLLYLLLDSLHLFSTYFYYQWISWRTTLMDAPLVVLGCGLFNETELSPTLKMRVQKGLHSRKDNNLLVMSGGQGEDEALPEACAMKNYGVQQGTSPLFIQVEPWSTTTYENLKNTKELLKLKESDLIYIISSNYHIPRSLYYANKLDLNGVGLYARSPRKLWCSMFFREWVAFIVLRRRYHLILFPLFCLFMSLFLANI